LQVFITLISTGPSKLSTLKLKQIYSNDNEKPQQQQQQQQERQQQLQQQQQQQHQQTVSFTKFPFYCRRHQSQVFIEGNLRCSQQQQQQQQQLSAAATATSANCKFH
jgi:hypothetical protein